MAGVLDRSAKIGSLARLQTRGGTWSIAAYDGAAFTSLASLNVTVYGLSGIGMPPLEQVSTAYGDGEGSVHHGTVVQQRPIVLRCAAASRTPALISQLLDVFKPDRVDDDTTPAILRYTGSALTLDLKLVLTVAPGVDDEDALVLHFVAHDPYFSSSATTTAALGVQTTVANANYVLTRSASGTWAAVSTGLDGQVNALLYSSVNLLYIGGDFTGNVKSWNGTTLTTLTGFGGTVYALAFAPDGTLYAAGVGGVKKWTGSAWSAIGAIGVTVNSIVFGRDGTLYAACGTSGVKRWTGSAWSAVGSLTGSVGGLAIGGDGLLYACGNATFGGVKKWTGSAWVGLCTSIDDSVITISFADGILYAVGVFTTINGTSAPYCAKHNGVAWYPLSSGLDDEADAVLPLSDGRVAMTGAFLTAGDVVLPDSIAFWNGSVFLPADVDLPGSAQLYALASGSDGRIAVGGFFSGSAIAGAVTVVNNVGSSAALPTITISLPSSAPAAVRLYTLTNFTTGKSIYFDYSLTPGETLTLTLGTKPKTLESSYWGDQLSAILPGSQWASWRLLPGNNSLSLLVGSSSATASLSYRARAWSLDRADTP